MRYAIYYLPDPASRLWAFGCAVLGYDAVSGQPAAFHDHPVFRPDDDISAEPRRYGFHATLKAPFALREGASEAELSAAVEDFAARRARLTIAQLRIDSLGSFLAMVPADAHDALRALAAACVEDFDRFRAPLTLADRMRRLKKPLTPNQTAMLDTWGYPFVFDEFRFHMTLTGPLQAPRIDEVAAGLRHIYAPIDAPVDVDAIALLRQPRPDAPFVVVKRCPLGVSSDPDATGRVSRDA